MSNNNTIPNSRPHDNAHKDGTNRRYTARTKYAVTKIELICRPKDGTQ